MYNLVVMLRFFVYASGRDWCEYIIYILLDAALMTKTGNKCIFYFQINTESKIAHWLFKKKNQNNYFHIIWTIQMIQAWLIDTGQIFIRRLLELDINYFVCIVVQCCYNTDPHIDTRRFGSQETYPYKYPILNKIYWAKF